MPNLHWKKKESQLIADCRAFSVLRHFLQAPESEDIVDFYVLNLSNWANIIAITPDKQVVFVKQHRHGIGEVTLEFPGGIIDPGENPAEAAKRELFEETGYKASSLIPIGQHYPNPALQNNISHTFLALDVEKVSEPTFDPEGYERIEVCLIPLSDIPKLIADGDITHGTMIVAFYYLNLYMSAKSIEE